MSQRKDRNIICRGILGTLLIHPKWFASAAGMTPEMFPEGNLQDVANLVWKNGFGATLALVAAEANEDPSYLMEYAVESLDDFEKLIEEGKNLYLDESTITIMQQATQAALSGDDVEMCINYLTESRRDLVERARIVKPREKLVENVSNRIDQSRSGGIPGISTGYTDLDKKAGGWYAPDLTIIGARPAMGKTTNMIELAVRGAKQGKGVAIFSYEMSSEQIATVAICQLAGVTTESLYKGLLFPDELDEVEAWKEIFFKLPITIRDLTEVRNTPASMWTEIQRIRMDQRVDLVFVDYLQLMNADGEHGNRSEEVSQISRALKRYAVQGDFPVIALAQLSRAVENRGGDRKPILADLRESGSIEQDADNVYFLYRPEVYGIEEDLEGNSVKGVTYWVGAKHRMFGGSVVGAEFKRFFRHGRLLEESELTFDDKVDKMKREKKHENIINPAVVNGYKATSDEDLPF